MAFKMNKMSDTHLLPPADDLTEDAHRRLQELNSRIQSHAGSWGEQHGGNKDENGVIEFPYWSQSPLIGEIVEFMYNYDLVITFDWGAWEEGRQWYKSEDESKYEKLDTEMALKLLTAVIRNDRFNEGALVNSFESGDFPKIINKFVSLKGDN